MMEVGGCEPAAPLPKTESPAIGGAQRKCAKTQIQRTSPRDQNKLTFSSFGIMTLLVRVATLSFAFAMGVALFSQTSDDQKKSWKRRHRHLQPTIDDLLALPPGSSFQFGNTSSFGAGTAGGGAIAETNSSNRVPDFPNDSFASANAVGNGSGAIQNNYGSAIVAKPTQPVGATTTQLSAFGGQAETFVIGDDIYGFDLEVKDVTAFGVAVGSSQGGGESKFQELLFDQTNNQLLAGAAMTENFQNTSALAIGGTFGIASNSSGSPFAGSLSSGNASAGAIGGSNGTASAGGAEVEGLSASSVDGLGASGLVLTGLVGSNSTGTAIGAGGGVAAAEGSALGVNAQTSAPP